MSENSAFKYLFDETILDEAQACRKEMICLKEGPSCRIGAVLNRNMLVVDCLDTNTDCPFFQGVKRNGNDESRGLCTCGVRHALWEKHRL